MRQQENPERNRFSLAWPRRIGAFALAAGLAVGVAAPISAQDDNQEAASVNLSESLVALHDGSCASPILEPEFELGTLDPQEYGEAIDDLADDDVIPDTEDLDDDGVLDDDEDLNDNGILDVGFDDDIDDDGILNLDEEGYLDEDLDDDDVLDDGEDLNDNGVLDAGIDADGDGVLGEDEIIPGAGFDADAVVVAVEFPTIWKAEGEVDATFDDLFADDEDFGEEDDDALGNPGIVAIHESAANYENIVACAEVTSPYWEDSDDVVLGLRPVDNSGVYGYVVFERDTGNIPIFGDNTTGVTVYAFENLSTLRETRMIEATPASEE